MARGQAGRGTEPHIMPLCSRCDGLRPETFYQTHTEPDEESSQVAVEPSSYLLWDSGPGLDNARRACEFCALLWAALLAELEKQEPRRTWLRLLPESGIRLEAKADIHKTTFPEPPSKGHHITSLQVIATAAASDGPKLLRGKVRLFAPRHPLCKSATNTPPHQYRQSLTQAPLVHAYLVSSYK